ncbi:putative golgin subfamily A member 6-like protein 3 [Pelobates fuscus]|uniref:putative golgin subfamily A member 6-like protein 3 n=1 Tax=Pelobates fuscus TaxID=191477 RepID=UPI002FE4971A
MSCTFSSTSSERMSLRSFPKRTGQAFQEDISGRHSPQESCRECVALREEIQQVHLEKEKALRDQKQMFQDQLVEIAKNRKHLEEERMAMFRRKLEQEMEEKMQVLCRSWKAESVDAIEEACEETRREAERAQAQEIQRVLEEARIRYEEHEKEAVSQAVQMESRNSQLQIADLENKHREDLEVVHEKVYTVQEQLNGVIREKMDFESKFKELQLNYKRFIDLTDSALHSDYLLRLIRLGKPPGFAHCAVQTEDIITNTNVK